ncbi:MAG: ABC-type bacteriocin/lantibiotic exporter with N-terminal double-glycine peptidase domain [Chitinophagaceae bacterium]|nr:MAG: ABC-type bacteriocin/lantibiotic exporter with N-terminal double-glycine peptidase domain [Chitinophagaceae bacterium]
MGNKEVTNEAVTKLVNKCGLTSFIESLPNGYDTLLDPTGKKLTAKVRQDILLLRALLGKKRLLLLEEPLNFLEEEYKKHIANFMLKEETTTVIIATSEGNIAKECDLIILLDNGSIKAMGKYTELAHLINQ